MSLDEAIAYLQSRSQKRCDGSKIYWSIYDVTAVRTVIRALKGDG